MADSEKKNEEQKIEGAGLGGYATITLRDAKTGALKQQVTAKNKILARGLDYIIAHIIASQFPNAPANYHGSLSSSQYVTQSVDTNPFQYMALLYAPLIGSTQAVSFGEGRASSGNYYLHKNYASGAWTTDGVTGVDVITHDETIGDQTTGGSHSTSGSHVFSNENSGNRPKILSAKALASMNATDSIQSNQSAEAHFQKCFIVFNFSESEAVAATNEGVNCIAWADNSDCQYVGVRLQVPSVIPKTAQDTLDITYTFDLTVT